MQMSFTRSVTAAVVTIAVSGLLVAGALAAPSPPAMSHSMTANMKSRLTASDLRVILDNLVGEHVVLAMNATNAGVIGAKSCPAAATALDNNSVALSKAIGSIYGAKAATTFLNGKFMWRAHIKYFVDYIVAKAKKDVAGQNKAVANLKQYTVTFGEAPSSAPTAAPIRSTPSNATSRPALQARPSVCLRRPSRLESPLQDLAVCLP